MDEERYYRALLSRDARFDGHFFAAVLSTGIYCRPICPAPKPRRRNVRFFPSAAACRRAGFRPCRRCVPQAAPGTPEWIGTPALVTRALRRLHAEPALVEAGLEGFARSLGVSSRHLRRVFHDHVGAPPSAVLATRRVQLAFQLLRETSWPVTRIAYAAGFRSVRRFQTAFREACGAPPTAFRRPAEERRAHEPAGALRVALGARSPFDWSAFVRFLAPRVVPCIERIDAHGYERLVEGRDGVGVLRVAPRATQDGVDVTVPATCLGDELLALLERVTRLFDLRCDPATLREHLGTHPELAHAFADGRCPRLPGAFDPFETAVRCLLGQQVSVAGATTLAARLVERFGTRLATAHPSLTHRFPRPDELADADLAGLGMPTARAETVRAFARAAGAALPLDGSLAFEEFVARARTLPGIGDWTAHVIAMRALSEPDAFPATDLGVRRALAGKTARERERIAAAWRPWRSYACIALWTRPIPPEETTHGLRPHDA